MIQLWLFCGYLQDCQVPHMIHFPKTINLHRKWLQEVIPGSKGDTMRNSKQGRTTKEMSLREWAIPMDMWLRQKGSLWWAVCTVSKTYSRMVKVGYLSLNSGPSLVWITVASSLVCRLKFRKSWRKLGQRREKSLTLKSMISYRRSHRCSEGCMLCLTWCTALR